MNTLIGMAYIGGFFSMAAYFVNNSVSNWIAVPAMILFPVVPIVLFSIKNKPSTN
jgi:hypothetical protein